MLMQRSQFIVLCSELPLRLQIEKLHLEDTTQVCSSKSNKEPGLKISQVFLLKHLE